MQSKKGFTLIELLIVIIIIGVLATLAIPQYTKLVEKARAAEALTMVGALRSSEASYKLESGAYTTDLTKLYVGGLSTTSSTAQYWWYAGANATSTGYSIVATRTAKSSGGETGNTITFIWNDATGASWTGNHIGVPKL